jgi:hypothetical protein
MKKYTVISTIFFAGGIISFAAAAYQYQIYINKLERIAYYGAQSLIRFDNVLGATIYSLIFGIIELIVIGIINCIAGAFFIWKRFKKI